MRNLVLVLILANLVYFLWTRSVSEPTIDTGVTRLAESELSPVAKIAPAAKRTPAVSQNNEDCLSVGALTELPAAEEKLAMLRSAGVGAAIREATGEIFDGHWVQVLGLKDRAAARGALGKLKNGGIKEAYIAGDAEIGFSISLGLFKERPRADRIGQDAGALGVTATISDRTRPAEIFWIDVATGESPELNEWIGTLNERDVLRGSAATCPK